MAYVGRPFRHLCPEADRRDAMTDAEFWEHVFSPYAGFDMMPEAEGVEGPEDSWGGIGVAFISDHVSPCPVCGEWGPCGTDIEGRPMIHAFYDAGDES